MNPRLQIMLDSQEIEALAAPDEEVLGMWSKAVRTARSASVPGLAGDPDSQFTLIFQSAFQGATAVVRAAGFRVRGENNYHLTSATVAALALGELSAAARDLNGIRQRRHAAVYDWDSTIGPDHLNALRRTTNALLREAGSWLRQQRPSMPADCEFPPGTE